MPFFSVIIPTYNRAKLIGISLDSVLAQEANDLEIILVDDGSTDATLNVLSGYQDQVRICQQANRGPGSARNLGARHASGKYLAFLDSDDLWFPWTLETYMKVIDRCQRPAFVAGKPLSFRTDNELGAATSSEPEIASFSDYLASGTEWRWWGVSSFVVRKDAFESVGGFADEWINGEDADLALRLGVAPGFVQVTQPFTFGYREHAQSEMKNLERTIAGARHKLRAELQGLYPGGPNRARERWRILTRHIRPVSLDCLRQGLRKQAWELYRATFGWHARLGRWKYLAGFPLKASFARA